MLNAWAIAFLYSLSCAVARLVPDAPAVSGRVIPTVRSILHSWDALYRFVPRILVADVRFGPSSKRRINGTLLDTGRHLGHGGVSHGWLCNGTPFDHPMDGVRMPGLGVAFDAYDACAGGLGYISWEIGVPLDGLYEVQMHLGVQDHRVGDCTLNGVPILNTKAFKKVEEFRPGVLRTFTRYAVVVTAQKITIGGPRLACGWVGQVVVIKLFPPVGDTDCWSHPPTGTPYEFHLCCGGPAGMPVFDCWHDAFSYERCCRSTKHTLAATAGMPTSLAPERPCLLPRCQRQCLGASAEWYKSPPHWVVDAPYPKPMHCDGVAIWPLTLPVRIDAVVECLPIKTSDFALLWPGDLATYPFLGGIADPVLETMEYFHMYRSALFSITAIKSAPDAFRHTEILASGSVPIFLDLQDVPVNTMPHHNRALLSRARELPGVAPGRLSQRDFNGSAYLSLAQDLLMWTRHRLTTSAMARYVLDVVGVPRTSYDELSVLYLCHPTKPSFYYLSMLLLHGLRKVLSPANVVDFPYYEDQYEWDPLWSLSHGGMKAPSAYMSARWALPRLKLDRSLPSVRQRLQSGNFDYVIYGWTPAVHPLDEDIFRHIPKERIIAIDLHDHMPHVMMDTAKRVGFFFKLNLADQCPADKGLR